jgi:hypothetical protein
MLNLFDGTCSAPVSDDFRWSVAVFRANGASQTIARANKQELKTYFPIRRNKNGNFIPLWANYLFIEFQNCITIDICRATSNFIKILSIDNQPILVKKDAIRENMKLLELGKFDDVEYRRRFYGRGSLVRIINGEFAGKNVELLTDILPDMLLTKKVPILIEGWKASIELGKLAIVGG